MQVSAISANSCQTVFNTKINSRGGDSYIDTYLTYLNSNPKNNSIDNQAKVFESINEWKNFCHSQIEQGKLDIIA